MKIYANMIVGAKEEPFLKYSLRSIFPCVDEIVIVANDGDNLNASTIEKCSKVSVYYRPFKDFATARNIALSYSTAADYILWVDADEVHFIRDLSRFIEEAVSKKVDCAQAAFFHFVKDNKHYQSIDPRNILLRNGIFKWTKAVDEYPEFISKGQKMLLSKYRYHHYGYTKDPQRLWEDWMDRAKILGTREWFEDKDPKTILDDRVLIPYEGEYPEVMECV